MRGDLADILAHGRRAHGAPALVLGGDHHTRGLVVVDLEAGALLGAPAADLVGFQAFAAGVALLGHVGIFSSSASTSSTSSVGSTSSTLVQSFLLQLQECRLLLLVVWKRAVGARVCRYRLNRKPCKAKPNPAHADASHGCQLSNTAEKDNKWSETFG